MENVRAKRWSVLTLVFACATVLLMAAEAAAQSNSSPSWWPFGKSASPTPPPAQDDDPIALKTHAEAGAELYVSVARLYAESGKFTEADEEYLKAVKKFPDDIRVLLGYAMFKDQTKQPQAALKLYEQAEKKHPKEPSVYNNLAIHYSRQDMLPEAIEAARHAVTLRPREPRYCNNLATLLVQAGRPEEAFKQLREIYDEPVAHYDLGYLLNKRGMQAAALQEFTIALRLSPGMASARQWVERLSRERGEGSPAMIGMMPPPAQAPLAVAANPSGPRQELPPAPPAPSPPLFVAPPQYVAGPQYPNPAPAQVPYPAQPQNPAQAQYPQVQYVAQPQNAGPQNTAAPQYQNLPPASPPVGNPPPLVASRTVQAGGGGVVPPPPAADDNTLRRLPPIHDPRYSADPNRDPQGPDVVAPGPPDWRR